MRIGLICCLLCVSALPAMAESIELPSFGIVSAPTPRGWRRAIEPDSAMAARWEFGDGKAKEPTGIIDIQLYPKRSATNVKQLVQKEAKRLGGQILAESVELGGLEAFQFIIPPKSPGNETANPLRARFIKHGNIYLALVERVATEKTTAAAFDQIAKEMQLGNPCEPSEALRDRGQPIELRAVNLVMDLPDPFRLASDGKRQQDYCVINFNNEKSDVEMAVTAISTFNQALGDFLPTLGKSLARQYKWPDAPTWNRVSRKDRIEVAYSDLIPAGVDERGKPTNAMQLVAVAHNGAAQLLTLQYPGPADATAKYVEHVAKIAASVRNAARPK